MKTEDSLKKLKEAIKEHKNLLVHYGIDDNDPEEIYFDTDIKKYRGWLGIWSMELLLQIARGEVENIYLEEKEL